MQQQINELSAKLEETLLVVQRIEHGQLDDRIGLLEAGRQGVILALSQKDENIRNVALLNAMNNIMVAQNQIFEAFKRRVTDFKPIPKTGLAQFLKSMVSNDYLSKRDNEYDEIQEYYNLYLEATRMLANSYILIGDNENAQKVFDMNIEKINSLDYSKLKTIEYAHKDSEFQKLYENAAKYLSTEKQLCIKEGTTYDCLKITISGEQLVEVIENGTEISTKETK